MNVDVKSAVIIIYIYLVLLFIYTTFGYIVIIFLPWYFVRTLSDQGQEKLFPRRRKASEEIGSTFL